MLSSLIAWFKTDGDGRYKTGSLRWKRGTSILHNVPPRWRLSPVFAWYDLCIGIYIDVKKDHAIYVMILPCCGFKFYYG